MAFYFTRAFDAVYDEKHRKGQHKELNTLHDEIAQQVRAEKPELVDEDGFENEVCKRVLEKLGVA